MAVLPQLSIAVQRRMSTPPLAQLVPVCNSVVFVMLTLGSQLSVAVGMLIAGMASQLTVASAGTNVNTGTVTSRTVMVCVAAAELPQLSVAVQRRCNT
jgi:hypothetical protein